MKKRKIIIFSHAMELGGAERSLLGLLEALNPNVYEIDLFLMRHEGELLKFIPDYVNLLPEVKEYTALARPMVQVLKEGHILLTLGRLYGKIAAKRYSHKMNYVTSDVALDYSHKYTKRWMPLINPNTVYELAISFLTPHYFVSEKINANKKIAWIHTDYSRINIDVLSELAMWRKYDHIVSISDSVSNSFLSVFPTLKEKLVVFENILPETTIRHQMEMHSDAIDLMTEGRIKLLSIGRFCEAKNFDNIPQILAKIRQEGVDAHWYIMGYGPDETLIQKRIIEAGMCNYIHILGKTDNPYPYIQLCDIYVQPSRYEGRCVTVKEAQMLGKPVIITRYATSASQLDENVDGVIVEMDNDSCAKGIVSFIHDNEKRDAIIAACNKRNYSNREQIKILDTLFE